MPARILVRTAHPTVGRPTGVALTRYAVGVARIVLPVEERLAIVLRQHLDAVHHRAGDLAQVAAHALGIDHLVPVATVGLGQAGDGLVRGVFAGDVAAAATDAGVLVDPGDHLVVDVQVLPVGGVAHRLAGEVRQALVALAVHPARQAVLHLLDDAKTMQHGGSAHLHRAATEGDELGRVAPAADAADAADRQAAGLGVAGDLGDHVQGDRLDRRAAVAAVGALAAGDGVGDHALQVDAGDRVDGVDQRHRVGATAIGGAGGSADVGDVRRQFDDHRQRAVSLAPAGDPLDVFRHLADRRAHAALGHAVGAAEVQLDTVAAGGLHQRQYGFPGFLDAGHHQRNDQRAVRPVLLHLGDLAQVDLQGSVGDQFDIVEAEHLAVGAEVRGVARRHVDRRRVLAEGLPDHPAPAGLEGADHVVGLVGRRRAGQPEGVGCLDAGEFDGQIGHLCSLHVGHELGVDGLGGQLAVLHGLNGEVLAQGGAVAAGVDAGDAGAQLGVDPDALALALEFTGQRVDQSTGVEGLADGAEDGVGGQLEALAG